MTERCTVSGPVYGPSTSHSRPGAGRNGAGLLPRRRLPTASAVAAAVAAVAGARAAGAAPGTDGDPPPAAAVVVVMSTSPRVDGCRGDAPSPLRATARGGAPSLSSSLSGVAPLPFGTS